MFKSKDQFQEFLNILISTNGTQNTSRQNIEEMKREVRSDSESPKCHSKDSTNPPQRIMKQMFKQFFENHIIVCEKKFYCCCCKKFLIGHCAAFEHTSEANHCDLVERITAMKTSWILLNESTDFRLLVSQAITSFDANNFKCRICNDEMFAISKLAEHLQNFWHIYQSLNFNQKLIEKRDRTTSIFSDLEQGCDLIKYEKNRCPECIICTNKFSTVRACINLEERGDERGTERYARQSIIPPENEAPNNCNTIPEVPNLQLQETQHLGFTVINEKKVTSPEISKTMANTAPRPPSPIVQTKIWNSSSEVIAPPTKLQRARYPRSKSKTSSNFLNAKSPEELSRDYLFWKQDLDAWLCKICNKTVTGSHEITEHAAEIKHLELFKKYGCEKITMIEASVYNCTCCSCTIPGMKNVFAHLKGRRHSTCLAAMLRDQKSENEKGSSTTDQSGVTNDKKSELVIYVQHFQGLSIKKMIMRRLRAQKRSAPLEDFKCDYCQLHIVKGTDFHSHLASHISLEFEFANLMDENANDPSNFGLEKQGIMSGNQIKPKELSTSQLIVNSSSNQKENEKISNYSRSICTF
ncbi:uncharacterized protein [Venturia canescens]|uniref:uncharacterized protein n=1 Tax=Venturia canescens TaxID=32260 RepID=UPI001C9BCBFA|nr:uncharacterized protein LOC122415770 [Venturia canescens]XP_043284145.1 uncharacterized protein LOC122415770 [Venturia canescens]